MSVSEQLLTSVRKFGPAAKFAAKQILNVVLPGSPAIVEMVCDAFDCLHATADDWQSDEGALRQAVGADSKRVEQVLTTLNNDLHEMMRSVAALEGVPYAVEHLLSSQLGNHQAAMSKLESIAQRFEILENQNREILAKQGHSGAMLEEMLPLMHRIAGVMDRLGDFQMTAPNQAEVTIERHRSLHPVTIRKSATGNGRFYEHSNSAGEEWCDNALSIPFCWCPPGTFHMGSPADEPDRQPKEVQFEATITKGFWLGKFPVTQSQWMRVMGNNPSHHSAEGSCCEEVEGLETDRFPVEGMSWDDAREFCQRLTELDRQRGILPEDWHYALPTETQWEYACRAGTNTATAFGDSLTSFQANINDSPYNSEQCGPNLARTCDVGSYEPNSWGLHDMHGNVFEWCHDNDADPGDPESRRCVIRGGSWINSGRFARSAFRHWIMAHARNDFIGLRVALVSVSSR